MYDYAFCEECGTLNINIHTGSDEHASLAECHVCGSIIDKKRIRTFIIPSFGFEIDPDNIRKPGLVRPERTYRTDVSYVGYRSDIELKPVSIGRTIRKANGHQICDEDDLTDKNDGKTDLEKEGFSSCRVKKTITSAPIVPPNAPKKKTRVCRKSVSLNRFFRSKKRTNPLRQLIPIRIATRGICLTSRIVIGLISTEKGLQSQQFIENQNKTHA